MYLEVLHFYCIEIYLIDNPHQMVLHGSKVEGFEIYYSFEFPSRALFKFPPMLGARLLSKSSFMLLDSSRQSIHEAQCAVFAAMKDTDVMCVFVSIIPLIFTQSSDHVQLERMNFKVAKSGRVVNFVCTVISGEITEFLWTRDGHMIKNGEHFRIINRPESSFLTIKSVSQNDAGNYTCVAKNLYSEDRVSSTLTVEGMH